jgi:hypothetical protein
MEISKGRDFRSHPRHQVQVVMVDLVFIEIPPPLCSHLLTIPTARDAAHVAN